MTREAAPVDRDGLPAVLFLTGGERFAGIEAHLDNLLPAMVKEGASVQLASFSDGPLVRRMAARGIPCHLVRRHWKYDPGAVTRLARILRSGGFGMIHTHGYLADVAGLTAAGRVAGVGGVATVHGRPEPFSGISALKMRGNLLLDKWVVKNRANAVVAVSHGMVEWVTSSWGIARERVRIIHNGVREIAPDPVTRTRIRRELEIPPEAPVIGFVCRLERVKRPLLFAEIASRVLERRPDAVFLVLGKGPLLEKTRAAAAGAGGRIRFLGFREDVDQVLLGMDAIVNTSESEGIPLSLLEAMSCGVVPVAFAVGGLPEVIENGRNGVLVPLDDVDRFAEALFGLLEDGERRERYARAASETIRISFTARAMARATLDLYREIASGRSPR